MNGYKITKEGNDNQDQELDNMSLPQNSTIEIKQGYVTWKLRLVKTSESKFKLFKQIQKVDNECIEVEEQYGMHLIKFDEEQERKRKEYEYRRDRLVTYRPLQVSVCPLKNRNPVMS